MTTVLLGNGMAATADKKKYDAEKLLKREIGNQPLHVTAQRSFSNIARKWQLHQFLMCSKSWCDYYSKPAKGQKKSNKSNNQQASTAQGWTATTLDFKTGPIPHPSCACST